MCIRDRFLILLLVLLQGCISPQVKTGDISRYELPGLNNTTIFYLNVSSTQVIENINDRITFDYQITDNIATFKNPVAVDNSRNNASVNVSIITIMGRIMRILILALISQDLLHIQFQEDRILHILPAN